jgi:hypothetical protein
MERVLLANKIELAIIMFETDGLYRFFNHPEEKARWRSRRISEHISPLRLQHPNR